LACASRQQRPFCNMLGAVRFLGPCISLNRVVVCARWSICTTRKGGMPKYLHVKYQLISRRQLSDAQRRFITDFINLSPIAAVRELGIPEYISHARGTCSDFRPCEDGPGHVTDVEVWFLADPRAMLFDKHRAYSADEWAAHIERAWNRKLDLSETMCGSMMKPLNLSDLACYGNMPEGWTQLDRRLISVEELPSPDECDPATEIHVHVDFGSERGGEGNLFYLYDGGCKGLSMLSIDPETGVVSGTVTSEQVRSHSKYGTRSYNKYVEVCIRPADAEPTNSDRTVGEVLVCCCGLVTRRYMRR